MMVLAAGDLKARIRGIRTRFSRRNSTALSFASSTLSQKSEKHPASADASADGRCCPLSPDNVEVDSSAGTGTDVDAGAGAGPGALNSNPAPATPIDPCPAADGEGDRDDRPSSFVSWSDSYRPTPTTPTPTPGPILDPAAALQSRPTSATEDAAATETITAADEHQQNEGKAAAAAAAAPAAGVGSEETRQTEGCKDGDGPEEDGIPLIITSPAEEAPPPQLNSPARVLALDSLDTAATSTSQPRATTSDMPGKDQRPQIRKLSSICESPDPQPTTVAFAFASAIPATTAAAVAATSAFPAADSSNITTDDDDGHPNDLPLTPDLDTRLPRTPLAAPSSFLSAGPNGVVPSRFAASPGAALSPHAVASSAGDAIVSRPAGPPRRQSLISNRHTTLIQTLLDGHPQPDGAGATPGDNLIQISANMVTRKIWVRRPGASATLITINEDDLVDDVREMILRKYANSLGRTFDAPDLTLRIVPREQRIERTLGPEEPMSRTLDAYFPGGQTVEEALIIDVPLRRTPRASPRAGPPHAPHATSAYYGDELRPSEAGTDYFGPGALATTMTTHAPVATISAPINGGNHPHTISVLSTGQLPQIPSPGSTRPRSYRDRPERPRLGRQHTSSPTIIGIAASTGHGSVHGGSAHAGPITATAAASHGTQAAVHHTRNPRSRTHSNASSEQSAGPPAAPPMPTPPAPEAATIHRVATPPPVVPPRVASPRPSAQRQKKNKKSVDHPTLPAGLLGGGVPPINVLIVEDNPINLKLLEAFVKRLKVRWQTAINGREAVTKWRTGGFHLVLMDIQLPVMSGLDATREIRRLERVNSIGVFSSSASSAPEETNGEPGEEDKLVNTDMFKSPVIIVALTASSLQSDRHEALAAGCNDFLTKPVNFVWLERKILEWGCMQALIDFDGWRKWKDYSEAVDVEAAKKAAAAAVKAKTKKNRNSLNMVAA